MKSSKIVYFLANAIAILVMAFASISPAIAQTATPTPTTGTPSPTGTASPSPTPTATPIPYWWECVPVSVDDTQCVNGTTGPNGEPILDSGAQFREYPAGVPVGFNKHVFSGNLKKPDGGVYHGRIYMRVQWLFQWRCVDGTDGDSCRANKPNVVTATGKTTMNGVVVDSPNQQRDCSGGSCGDVFLGSYSIENMSNLPTTNFDVTLDTGWYGKASYRLDYRAIYSTMPISMCGDAVILETNTYDIIPTIEFPNGPNAVAPAVADEQIAYPEIGRTYRIYTAGQWNDGDGPNGVGHIRGPETGHFSYSFDGIIWNPLSSLPNSCVDYMGLTWTATDDEFRIRVNDIAGAFANNYIEGGPLATLTYTLQSLNVIAACSSTFSYDPVEDWIASGQIDSASFTAHQPAATITTGEWYALETAGQPWEYLDLSRFDIKVTAPPDAGLYAAEFSVWPYTKCWEYTGTLQHKRYYFQAPGAGLLLWANHTDGQPGNGHIGYNLYHATYTEIPTDCETSYNLNEKFIDDTLDAKAESGYALNPALVNPLDDPLHPNWVSGNSYMLETTGGPWSDEMPTRTSYDILISAENGADGTWHPLSEWPLALCVVETDMIGHMRVYFKYNGDPQRFKIRVDDDDFPGNSGGLDFEVWKVTDLDPGGSNCGDHFSKYPDSNETDVPPNTDVGTTVSMIVPDGTTYALETRGWWTDLSVPFSSAAISDNNGGTWYSWADYPDKLCFETFTEGTDPSHVYFRLYFVGAAGRYYKVRALDEDGNFSNNGNEGDFGVRLFKVNPNTDPWNTCATTFNLTPLQTDVQVPSQLITGVKTIAEPGKMYAIEITSGSWTNGSTQDLHYNAQLSFDTVADKGFYEFNDPQMPGWLCVARVGVNYARVYFNATQSPITYNYIRVGDSGDWNDNTGELRYTIYGARDINDPGDPPDDPPGGTAGCYANILRPSFTPWRDTSGDVLGVITVFFENVSRWFSYLGSWFPYIGNSIMTFFLWCPEHDAMVASMRNNLSGKEPVTTALKLISFAQATKTRFDSYNWSIGENAPAVPFLQSNRESSQEGSRSGTSLMEMIFPNNQEGSGVINPYAGGQLVYDPSLFSSGVATVRESSGATREISVTSCEAHVTYAWGSSGLIVGFCVVMNLVKLIGLDVWLNMFLTIACIIGFFRYFAAETAVLWNFSQLFGYYNQRGGSD